MTRCAEKVRYRDEIAAKIALASTQRKNASVREECRAYLCPRCGGWHLTSQSKEKQR